MLTVVAKMSGLDSRLYKTKLIKDNVILIKEELLIWNPRRSFYEISKGQPPRI